MKSPIHRLVHFSWHTWLYVWRRLWKTKTADGTGKIVIRKLQFLADACEAIWPTPGRKREPLIALGSQQFWASFLRPRYPSATTLHWKSSAVKKKKKKILQHYCASIGLCPMGNSGCFPWGKPAARESHYPIYGAWWVSECFHNPPSSESDMDYRTLTCSQMLINPCSCSRESTDTVRESALKGNWEKNPLPHHEIEPASATCRSDALPTELHPHPNEWSGKVDTRKLERHSCWQ